MYYHYYKRICCFATTALTMTANNNNNNNDIRLDSSPNVKSMSKKYEELANKLKAKLLSDEEMMMMTIRPGNGDNNSNNNNNYKNNNKQYWIGIAGGPGSGKTTCAEAVSSILNGYEADSTIVIPMDGWHTPQTKLIEKHGENAMKRRGAPWTFDVDLCYEQLKTAKSLQEADLPSYSREISDPVPNQIKLRKHHKIVLVEGLYLLYKDDDDGWSKVFDLWDETWFVKCPTREQQRERLIHRSLKTWYEAKEKMWGPGEEGAGKRVDYNDMKNNDLIRHCEAYADVVVVTE